MENLYIFHSRTEKTLKFVQNHERKTLNISTMSGTIALYHLGSTEFFPRILRKYLSIPSLFLLILARQSERKIILFLHADNVLSDNLFAFTAKENFSSHSNFFPEFNKKKQLNFSTIFFISFCLLAFPQFFSYFSHSSSFLLPFDDFFVVVVACGMFANKLFFQKYKDFFLVYFLFLPKDYHCISVRENNLAISSTKWHFPIIFFMKTLLLANLWGVFRRSMLILK